MKRFIAAVVRQKRLPSATMAQQLCNPYSFYTPILLQNITTLVKLKTHMMHDIVHFNTIIPRNGFYIGIFKLQIMMDYYSTLASEPVCGL